MSRRNFIELCDELTADDEQAFEELWRHIGLSVDWGLPTPRSTTGRRTSQRMFLRNLARGEAYSSEAPTLWDVDFQTAVAQAEMEDRERPGAYHRLRFGDIEIETTRPELSPPASRSSRTPTTSATRHRSAPTCTRRSSG